MTVATLQRPATAPSLLPGDRTPTLGRRRSFNNNKGGVGKTTTTIAIASALADRGRRVLVVDMEPQGNLTRRMAIAGFTPAGSIGDVLATKVKGGAAAAIVPCGWDTPHAALIDVLPADLTLADRDAEAHQPGSFGRLARVLMGVTDAYDYTLFDCRPTLGHLEQMVVRALDGPEDGYYLVVEPGHDAISGAARVISEMGTWAEDMEVGAPALGVIVNLYAAGTVLHEGRTASITESLTLLDGDGAVMLDAPPVLKPYIPRAVRIAELQDLGHDPISDRRLQREGHVATFMALAEAVDW